MNDEAEALFHAMMKMRNDELKLAEICADENHNFVNVFWLCAEDISQRGPRTELEKRIVARAVAERLAS